MRIGIASFLSEHTPDDGATIDRLVALGHKTEELGFGGVWVGDAMGRGQRAMDPMVVLACLCSVTQRIELGIAVVQTPLRHPVELAHRAQTLNVLSRGRFRFGVGAGSTRADFNLVGANFEDRFKTLRSSIDIMRRAWRGEPENGVALSPWKSNGGGPPIMLGAWRSPHWVSYAAHHCDGWIASGLYSKWEDLESAVRAYRRAGGKRAILTNVPLDPRDRPETMEKWMQPANISLTGPVTTSRDRLKRIEQLGFDDLIVLPPDESPETVEMIAERLRPQAG
ncbi:MAG: LLM class flavin-dependent oxidoreductase [Acetobacteraceae bacterium]